MTSHAPPPLLGRLPRLKPNQHHLPPLLFQNNNSRRSSSSNSRNFCSVSNLLLSGTEIESRHAANNNNKNKNNNNNKIAMNTATHNNNNNSYNDNNNNAAVSLGKTDGVSYAVEHQLPSLINNMMEDLLRERPESDVDGWMFHWFEEAYARRREEENEEIERKEKGNNNNNKEKYTQPLRKHVIKSVGSGGSCSSSSSRSYNSNSTHNNNNNNNNSHKGFIISRASPAVLSLSKNISNSSSNMPTLPKRNVSLIVSGSESHEISARNNTLDSSQYTIMVYSPLHISGLAPPIQRQQQQKQGVNVNINTNINTNVNSNSSNPSSPPISGLTSSNETSHITTSNNNNNNNMIAQRSLPTPPERSQHSAGETQNIISHFPRGAEFRLKSRSPQLLDINSSSSEGLAPKPI